MVCTDVHGEDATRFGCLKMNEDCRIEEFDEKPMVAQSNTISAGIYVIRRRQLIELIEKCGQEGRHDFVRDILIRYKNLKRIYGYKINTYWSNISTVESYYQTNMDFLKPEIRDYSSDSIREYSLRLMICSCKIQPGSICEKQFDFQRLYYQRAGGEFRIV